jgi:hypothetical protein
MAQVRATPQWGSGAALPVGGPRISGVTWEFSHSHNTL